MDLKEELASLLAAGTPLVQLVTYEEDRVVSTLESIEGTRSLGLVVWDAADGFRVVREGNDAFPSAPVTPDTILSHLAEKMPPGTIVVLRDFHHAWEQKKSCVTRKLRNMAPDLRRKNQFLFFTTPEAGLPAELKDDVEVLHVPLPGVPELRALFAEITREVDRSRLPGPEVADRLASSALGLTTNQARLAFARVWAAFGRFDEQGIEVIISARERLLQRHCGREFWFAQENEADVGGLERLKAWIRGRVCLSGADERLDGRNLPASLALVGIPGTGKGLAVRMLSGVWKLPVMRLDMGVLFCLPASDVQKRLSAAISKAEKFSPCILWLSGLHNSYTGYGFPGEGDARSAGPLLTWMREHRSPVHVVATLDDISAVPPVLMYSFERVFLLDIPHAAERRAIFLIHLRRSGVVLVERRLCLDELVERSQGFTGSEIERVVRESQFAAFRDGCREIEHSDLQRSLSEIVPLGRLYAEAMKKTGRWMTDGGALPASADPPGSQADGGRVFDV